MFSPSGPTIRSDVFALCAVVGWGCRPVGDCGVRGAKCGDRLDELCELAGTAEDTHVAELDAMLDLYEANAGTWTGTVECDDGTSEIIEVTYAAATRDQVQVRQGAVVGEPVCDYAVAENEIAFASDLAAGDGLAQVYFRDSVPEISMQLDGPTALVFQLGLDGTAWASLVDLDCHTTADTPMTRL